MKELMLGNKAVARGLYEAGCKVISSYPGTPSTEITEEAAAYKEVYCEWAPNEKVALEVAHGATLGGVRAACAMKHVGLNVAADPLFTISYQGLNAGLVVCVADDPGMHSSQNEQDSRHYAIAAKLPMLEPSDSEESRVFAKKAFEMSEKFNVTLEMGRYIAATCGVLISRIADMKMNDTTRYAIIDSGINHINYYGQAMAMKKPRCEFIPMEYTEGFADGADHEVEVYSQGVQPYNICGSLCTVGDVIVKNLELKDAKIGDMLAFYNIGAYSVTEGIYLFLSRRMPAIVMYSKKNGYRIIRNPVDTFLINSVSTQ